MRPYSAHQGFPIDHENHAYQSETDLFFYQIYSGLLIPVILRARHDGKSGKQSLLCIVYLRRCSRVLLIDYVTCDWP